jgi:hypothetical protein
VVAKEFATHIKAQQKFKDDIRKLQQSQPLIKVENLSKILDEKVKARKFGIIPIETVRSK